MLVPSQLAVFPDRSQAMLAFHQLRTLDAQTHLLTLYPFAFAHAWYLLLLADPLSETQQQDVQAIILATHGQVRAIPLALQPVVRLLGRRRAQRADGAGTHQAP